MISVVITKSTIEVRAAADYINSIANANGWTAENVRDFEREIESCDSWIAKQLAIEEWDCELDECVCI